MNRKSLIALVLVAGTLLSLAGCSLKKKTEPYEKPLRAFEAMLNNPDATWHDAVKSTVGGFCSDELTQLAELLIQTGDTTDERMTENLIGKYREVYGYECTFRFGVEEAEAMDEKTLQHEITEGYVLKVLVTVSGGDLKEAETSEDTINVLCIDGVWVIGDVFDKPYTK